MAKTKTYKCKAMAVIHETAAGMHKAGVLDKIAVRAHPPGDQFITAVTDKDLFPGSHPSDPHAEPQVEQRRSVGNCQADRQDYHMRPPNWLPSRSCSGPMMSHCPGQSASAMHVVPRGLPLRAKTL